MIAAVISIVPAVIDLPVRAVPVASDPVVLQVRNTGGLPVAVNPAALGGPNVARFAVVANQCSGLTLRPGTTCAVTVRATSGQLGATPEATLTISGPAAATGTGTRRAVLDPADCAALRSSMAGLTQEIAQLQIDLAHAAPGEKAAIAREIIRVTTLRGQQQARLTALGC